MYSGYKNDATELPIFYERQQQQQQQFRRNDDRSNQKQQQQQQSNNKRHEQQLESDEIIKQPNSNFIISNLVRTNQIDKDINNIINKAQPKQTPKEKAMQLSLHGERRNSHALVRYMANPSDLMRYPIDEQQQQQDFSLGGSNRSQSRRRSSTLNKQALANYFYNHLAFQDPSSSAFNNNECKYCVCV